MQIETFTSETYRITQAQLNQFADVTGGHGKIHVDPEYAKTTIFKATIVHGLFLVAMIEKELAKRFPSYEQNGTLEVTFIKPVKANQAFTISGELDENNDRLNISLLLENGEAAVIGRAKV